MKKTIFMALCMTTVVTFCACSVKNVQTPAESTPASSEAVQEQVTYFGSINKVVGNEVELSVAKIPAWAEQDNGGEDSEGGQGNLSGKPGDGEDQGQAQGNLDIGEGGSADDMASDDSGGTTASMASTLEYTGEKKTFMIPAGIEMTDYTGGKGDVSSLKKMNVLSLNIDKKTNTVISCVIWE